MNLDTHNKYFKDIACNRDASVSWRQHAALQETTGSSMPHYMTAAKEVYALRIKMMISSCVHVHAKEELLILRDSKSLLDM